MHFTFGAGHANPGDFLYAVYFSDVNTDHGWASMQPISVPQVMVDLEGVLLSTEVGQCEGFSFHRCSVLHSAASKVEDFKP